MSMTLQHKDLLEARVHLGHLASKWHPNMRPYIFMEREGMHIIDLNKTIFQLQEATQALQGIAKQGKKILFVATKKQAKNAVKQEAERLNMPYVTERWLGGTMTNFATIRRLIKKMTSFDKLMKDSAYKNMAKKEQLMIAREKTKLKRLLEGIEDTTRLPGALIVVDTQREHIAVKEARKLGIPIFALADTNSNPSAIEYPIPSNDDATTSIEIIVKALGAAIESGLEARKLQHAEEQDKEDAKKPKREKTAVKVAIPKEGAGDSRKKVVKTPKVKKEPIQAATVSEPKPRTEEKVAAVKTKRAPSEKATKAVMTEKATSKSPAIEKSTTK